jgi:hypothetical protein
MVNEFFTALRLAVVRPWLVLVGALPFLLTALLLLLLYDIWFPFFIDLAYSWSFYNVEFAMIPFRLLSAYPVEVGVFFFLFLLSAFFMIWFYGFYALYTERAAREQYPFFPALKDTLARTPGFALLTIFITLISVVLLTGLWFLLVLALNVPFVGFPVVVLALIFGGLAMLRFVFVVPEMALEGQNVRNALKKSWRASAHHFYALIGLAVLLMFANFILYVLVYYVMVSDMADELAVGLAALLYAFMLALTSLSFSLFYLHNVKSVELNLKAI